MECRKRKYSAKAWEMARLDLQHANELDNLGVRRPTRDHETRHGHKTCGWAPKSLYEHTGYGTCRFTNVYMAPNEYSLGCCDNSRWEDFVSSFWKCLTYGFNRNYSTEYIKHRLFLRGNGNSDLPERNRYRSDRLCSNRVEFFPSYGDERSWRDHLSARLAGHVDRWDLLSTIRQGVL